MRIKFNKIELHNFLSIENAELNLSGRGYTLVYGVNKNKEDNAQSNGSGKSTIFEAISWALTGETIRGTKDVVRLGNNDGCYVKISFTYNNDEYEIIRSKEHAEYKTNLFIFINGENKSGKGIRDSQYLLNDYIPDLTSELLGAVIILGQGLPQKFSSNTPSGRKAVIEKLSKSDFMIEDIKQRLGERKNTLEDELRNLEDSKLKTDTEISVNTKSISDKEVFIDSLEEVTYDTVKEAEDKLEKLKEEKKTVEESLQASKDKSHSLVEEIYKLKQELAEKQKEVDKEYSDPLSELNLEYGKLHGIAVAVRGQINSINKISLSEYDVCPTCGQKIPEELKLSTDKEEAQLREITAKEDEISHQIVNINNTIANKKDEISHDFESKIAIIEMDKDTVDKFITDTIPLFSNCTTAVQVMQNKVNELISKHDNYYVTRNRVIKEIEKLKERNEELKTFTETLVKSIEEVKSKIDVESKLNTIATREFRGYLISGFIDIINTSAKRYCKDVFENENIEIKLDGNNVDIIFNSKLYENLSGGEKQKIDLIVQFAIRYMMTIYLNFSSNLLVLDEIFDNCDAKGCENLLSMINKNMSDIDSVFIVTHHEDLNIPNDSTIIIEKGEDGVSRVTYQ